MTTTRLMCQYCRHEGPEEHFMIDLEGGVYVRIPICRDCGEAEACLMGEFD